MNRPVSLFFAALLTAPLLAQDVFVPPVPKGIAVEGRVRTPKGPIPFPSAKERWIRIRSERFDLISSAGEATTRRIANDLETLAAALATRTGFVPRRDVTPATVFVFARRRDSQPYFDLLFAREKTRANGAYVRHDGGGTMFIDASPRIARTAMHELIHDLLRQGGAPPPLWLEEGLAEYFSNATIRNGRVVAGELIPEHVATLQRHLEFTLDELLAVKAESNAASTSAFYAQSWALVEWLIHLDEEAFFRLLRDAQRRVPVREALATHYGKASSELSAGIRWRDRVPKLVSLETETRTRELMAAPLDRATLLYELGNFLRHVAGAEQESERHLREALTLDPKHAKTLAALGEYERAVAADPNDAEVHLLYAESLLSTATGVFAGIFQPADGDAERFRKARALAARALEIGGDEGRAHGTLGTTYLVESDLAPGIEHLERARTLLPQRMDYALNLYAMYLRAGAREQADALFAAAFENARDRQTHFAARNVLLTYETERANTLSREGRLDEAAAVVRQLAANTSDPNGRRELEEQAAQLEATALVNRHIALYNDAIALANRGKNRDAVKVLDDLLAVATDAAVIKDATQLRAELKKR